MSILSCCCHQTTGTGWTLSLVKLVCWIVTVVVVSLVLHTADSRPTKPPVKLIIDTDGVADDARAISLALQHPDAQVIGITTVHGCITVHQATSNVARILRVNKAEVPVFKGAEFPIIRKNIEIGTELDFVYGKDGLGDQPSQHPKVLPSDASHHEKEIAALALIRLTRDHPDVTLVCIGPLTNLALAIKLDPNFARQPKRIVIMGGNYFGFGNVDDSHSAEFNFHGDPEAAAIVLREMEVPITVVPWEANFLNAPQYMKEVDFEAHLNHPTKLGSFLSMATSIARSEMKKSGVTYTFCDEIAVATAISPSKIVDKMANFRVNVELAGKFTRGQVVVDWFDVVYNEKDSQFMANPSLNKTRKTTYFVTSYNVGVLDGWIHNTVKGEGEW